LLSVFISQIYAGKADAVEREKAFQYLNTRNEVTFYFYVNSMLEIQAFSDVISIDRVDGNRVFAYANTEEFNRFLTYNLPYEVTVPPGLQTQVECSDLKRTSDGRYDWTKYFTYSAYVTMMGKFETDYPAICKKYEIGTTVNGKKLLGVKISDNVALREREPEFLATSTIHGDETFGFQCMLRMIDYLLTNYSTDATAKKIVDNIELWIFPNVNPDGTYGTGENMSQAQRYNANGIELNRNFFTPGKPYGNYTKWENETKALIDLEDAHNFILDIDIHGGMENCVFPWAYTASYPKDKDWFIRTCTEYVKTARTINPNYLTNTQSSGYGSAGTNYYTAHGTRIDGPYYRSHVRGITLELNTTKKLAESNLETYWNYNKQSLLNLFLETLNGIHGVVTDSMTGKPINNVKVFVDNFDVDSTFTRSDTNGTFARPIHASTFNITFSHPNYKSKTVTGVKVEYGKPTVLDVQLVDKNMGAGSIDKKQQNKGITILSSNRGFRFNFGKSGPASASIYSVTGKLIRTLYTGKTKDQDIFWDGKDFQGHNAGSGCYVLKAHSSGQIFTANLILKR